MPTRRHILAGLAALPLASCQVAPGTGKSGFNLLSAEEERKLGRETHPQILKEFGGAVADPGIQAYVAGLGQRIVRVCETPEAEFRFTVLDSPVVNAMALPGGYIYVTRGLMALCGNEAELAGVVGHEIGHVLARHTAERVSQAQASNVFAGILGLAGAVVGIPGVGDVAQYGAAAYLQSFSRDQENEADHLGLRYLVRAGWDAHAMATMLERLREQARLEALMAGRSPDSVDRLNLMASHPRTLDRIHAAQAALGPQAPGTLGTDALLDRLDGMIYGDDSDEGVVRDRVFAHPDAGFRFEVPPGFRLVNGARQVTARNADGAIVVFDSAAHRGDPESYISRVWLARAGVTNQEILDINGLSAATATTKGRTNQGSVDIRVVAIRFDAQTLYRFTFVTPPRQTAALGEELRRTTHSFRRLTAEERAAIKPWRIQVAKVQPGDTVDRLAARMAPPAWKSEIFRVLNGLGPREEPAVGKRVKMVV